MPRRCGHVGGVGAAVAVDERRSKPLCCKLPSKDIASITLSAPCAVTPSNSAAKHDDQCRLPCTRLTSPISSDQCTIMPSSPLAKYDDQCKLPWRAEGPAIFPSIFSVTCTVMLSSPQSKYDKQLYAGTNRVSRVTWNPQRCRQGARIRLQSK